MYKSSPQALRHGGGIEHASAGGRNFLPWTLLRASQDFLCSLSQYVKILSAPRKVMSFEL